MIEQHLKQPPLESLLRPGVRAHMIGIGGVSMSPLAEVLHQQGVLVTGSDERDGAATRRLRELGIPVAVGHAPEQVRGAELIIRTAAARDENVEVAAARALGIPVYERAEAWGQIMRAYRNAVCVAGTHGKTTTTSMIAQILLTAAADPTVMIGGTLPSLGSGYRVGRGDTIVLEACEYYNSFHSFFPTLAVVLNIDDDHLDFFGNLENVKASFADFAALVPESGKIVCNGGDANTMDALSKLNRELVTFGFEPKDDVRCENFRMAGTGSRFDVLYEDRIYCRAELRVPGRHNAANALAAAAVAVLLGIPGEAVEDALLRFTGAERRFEPKGSINGADIYDDYAHHPSELHALLDMVSALPYERVLLAFQPHTYTRTSAHFDVFTRELQRADKVYLAEIYAAREENTTGVTSADLARGIPNAVYCPTFSAVADAIAGDARAGDIVLTVGAGELYLVGEALANR
ncbi:MAG: UDP-N-acetylmuramate--L-alanine ligase [Oscillospiraceae bacterium]|jgi:UDP-N-acetylmuramate--alanine ligase|nr:UDP-N-acetylmuramate--L-alanine ligase [Oscillospiraceae bacterium]